MVDPESSRAVTASFLLAGPSSNTWLVMVRLDCSEGDAAVRTALVAAVDGAEHLCAPWCGAFLDRFYISTSSCTLWFCALKLNRKNTDGELGGGPPAVKQSLCQT